MAPAARRRRAELMDPRVRRAHRVFDVYAGALVRKARREGHAIPCGRGCDACCRDVAWITMPEARELAERVASMPTARRELVLAGVRAWFDGMAAAGLPPEAAHPSVSAYARARLVCPLLDVERQECTVYSVRPLSCRAHYVIAPDASGCANRAEVPTVTSLDLEHECSESALSMVVGIAGGDVYALRRMLLPRLLVVGLVDALRERGLWEAA
jgi:Fe-S-cluster containining protein